MSNIIKRVEQSTTAQVQEKQPSKLTLTAVSKLLDKAQRLQAPQVKKYVDSIRRRHPDESPQQIIERLEKHYLRAVTGTGSAVGAAAAVPGVGTITAMGAATGETALFLETSALLALAIAEVVARFGSDVLGTDGRLDRAALRVRVFHDDEARRAKHASNGHKLTDFNDLHALEGLHVVRTQVEARLTELQWARPAAKIAVNLTIGGEGKAAIVPFQSYDELLKLLDATEAMITPNVARQAVQAASTYGKVAGHPADLNMGDCFSYAMASAYKIPLLYKGNDFAKTDLG